MHPATAPTKESTPTSTTILGIIDHNRGSLAATTLPQEDKEEEQGHQQEQQGRLMGVTSILLQEQITKIWCWGRGEWLAGGHVEFRL